MEILSNTFEKHLQETTRINLHGNKKAQTVLQSIPKTIESMPHLIFYGPPGIGKYSQSLQFLSKISPSQLRYERKMYVDFNKEDYIFRISDIHFEVDMMQLGCHAKVLWHTIFQQIKMVIETKKQPHGVILCKNIHATHGELLDILYTYLSNALSPRTIIKFIFLTESVSFLPNSLYSSCFCVQFGRPSKTLYQKILHNERIPKTSAIEDTKTIYALKQRSSFQDTECLVETFVDKILSVETLKYEELREIIYEILLRNHDVQALCYDILVKLESMCPLTILQHHQIIQEMPLIFKRFNNNYRPIYHLENYFLMIIGVVHGIKEGVPIV
jgi:DNA polymerase III delta prime subunit